MKWKIAASQMPVYAEKDRNLSQIIADIERARRQQADVICFPESCLVRDEENAESLKKELAVICKAAAEAQINVIFGTYILDSKRQIRNQVLVIDRSGTIVKRYNKKHLYRDESSEVVCGYRNAVFTLDGIQCIVIICWDYAFPEDIRKLAKKGAEVIFCPSYLLSHPYTKEVLTKIPQVRAFDAMSYFVMVDAFASESFQQSAICHPLHCIKKLQGKPGIIYGEIDTTQLKELRNNFRNITVQQKKLQSVE